MTCVVVKAQWGLHPRGMNARVPGYTGFIPSAKAEATKGLKRLVGPRPDVGKLTGHHPYLWDPWPGACAGALNQRSWSTCRNPWRTSDGIRTTRRHLASGWRSDLGTWNDLTLQRVAGIFIHLTLTSWKTATCFRSKKNRPNHSNVLYGRHFNIHNIT